MGHSVEQFCRAFCRAAVTIRTLGWTVAHELEGPVLSVGDAHKLRILLVFLEAFGKQLWCYRDLV